jgi:1-acyl-sn-glycerol-3-phosphate acyltransferase
MPELSPDQTALVVVVVLAALAIGLIVARGLRYDGGCRLMLLYSISRLYAGIRFRVRADRRCTYPDQGAALIVANHRSPVDPVLLMQNSHLKPHGSGKFRIVSFMMLSSYYDIHPLTSFICRSMRSIPVDRSGQDMSSVKQALRELKAGHLVGIFPEAGINQGSRGLLPADTGAAWLALSAKVPVIPVFIHGAPTGKNMVDPFLKSARVRLSYGDPISLDEFHGQRKTQELLQVAMLRIMHELGRLGGVDMTDYRCLLPGEERHTE